MPRPTTHIVLSLLLTSLCSCNDMRWRKLPEEKDIVFEGTAKAPQKSAYRPGQARDIQLDLTSSDEEAKEAKFKILSAKLADGSNADIDYDSLKLGPNTLHYTPQEPGTHKITLKVAVEEEEESAKTFHYTVEAPAAEWRAVGRANSQGQITLTIDDAPEAWQVEPWRIINTTFSEGLQGRIEPMPTRLNHGDNNLNVILDQVELQEEEPHVLFTIQGPDDSQRDYQADLTALCVAQLRDEMGELDRDLEDRLLVVNEEHETEIEELYPLESETVTDPRVNRKKQQELTHRLSLMERDLATYDRDLQRLETLETQDPDHPNRQLPTFRRGKQLLQDAIASLKSAQVQLQQQCTTAHEALFKTLKDEDQEASMILLDDPRLDVNARDENYLLGNSLVHFSARNNNAICLESLIERGADLNKKCGELNQAPLHETAHWGHEEATRILLNYERLRVNEQCDAEEGGNSALHIAAGRNHENIVRLLINDQRTYINLKNRWGETALSKAQKSGHTNIVDLIKNAIARHQTQRTNP